MELRTLKYLISLHRRGSFTAAARDHFITQPAVSIQLRKLQEELGVTLFEVHGRSVRFTRVGEKVLEYAERFSNLERELLQELEDLGGLRKGGIMLGTIDAASIYVLPRVFLRFKELYPAINVHLEIASTLFLLGRLGGNEIDLVIGTLPVDGLSHDYEVLPIYKEDLVVIAPPGHPLTGRKDPSIEMLSEFPFISFHKESVTRGIVERGFQSRGVTPRITMDIDSPEAIKKLVASGLGLAVLPLPVVEDEISRGSLSLLGIKDLKLERRLGLIVPPGRYLPATARAFLGVLEEVLGIRLPDRFRPARKHTG